MKQCFTLNCDVVIVYEYSECRSIYVEPLLSSNIKFAFRPVNVQFKHRLQKAEDLQCSPNKIRCKRANYQVRWNIPMATRAANDWLNCRRMQHSLTNNDILAASLIADASMSINNLIHLLVCDNNQYHDAIKRYLGNKATIAQQIQHCISMMANTI